MAETSDKKEKIIADKLIIARKSLCNLSHFKLFAKFDMWITTLKNKNTTNADVRLMNSPSVLSLSSCVCLQGSVRSVTTGGVLKKGLRLVPLNNSTPGAGKRGPGTNVAIMLMVRITADSHY